MTLLKTLKGVSTPELAKYPQFLTSSMVNPVIKLNPSSSIYLFWEFWKEIFKINPKIRIWMINYHSKAFKISMEIVKTEEMCETQRSKNDSIHQLKASRELHCKEEDEEDEVI